MRHRAPFATICHARPLRHYRKEILARRRDQHARDPRKQRAMVRKAIGRGLAGEMMPKRGASSRCTPTTCTVTARPRFE